MDSNRLNKRKQFYEADDKRYESVFVVDAIHSFVITIAFGARQWLPWRSPLSAREAAKPRKLNFNLNFNFEVQKDWLYWRAILIADCFIDG